MTHLTDSQLNEYLDQVLDALEKQECDLHLSSCSECRARLDQLQHLFASLDNLPERSLQRDLSASIVNRLPQKQSRLWTPTFAAQVGVALGVFVWLSVQVTKLITPLLVALRLPQIAMPNFQFPIPVFQFPNFYSLFSIFISLFTIPKFRLPIIAIPTFRLSTFKLSPHEFAFIAIAICLLWLIGNLSLLRNHSGIQK